MDNTHEWRRPVLKTQGKILHWETKALHNAPQIPVQPAEQLDGGRQYFTSEAQKIYRVPNDERAHWGWVCRIYTREPAAGSPVKGHKMATEWGTATASFIKAAHQEGQKGQWLITAAHNLVSSVYEHDGDGILTGDLPALAPADAIYIEVGFGDHKLGVWADKVAIMKGYYDKVANIDVDGAAIHIKDSTIPAEFWMKAPPIYIYPAPSKTLSFPFTIAGFPGGINEYPEMQGFYVTGFHTPVEGPVKSTAHFKEVPITPTELKNFQGHYVLKFDKVPASEGFSGSALVIGSENDRKIVAVLNTVGIAALVVGKNAEVYGVDITSLLEAIGGSITITKI